eukprot:1160745-Pelagomonas_calceolata.AAC.14
MRVTCTNLLDAWIPHFNKGSGSRRLAACQGIAATRRIVKGSYPPDTLSRDRRHQAHCQGIISTRHIVKGLYPPGSGFKNHCNQAASEKGIHQEACLRLVSSMQ